LHTVEILTHQHILFDVLRLHVGGSLFLFVCAADVPKKFRGASLLKKDIVIRSSPRLYFFLFSTGPKEIYEIEKLWYR